MIIRYLDYYLLKHVVLDLGLRRSLHNRTLQHHIRATAMNLCGPTVKLRVSSEWRSLIKKPWALIGFLM